MIKAIQQELSPGSCRGQLKRKKAGGQQDHLGTGCTSPCGG